MSLPGKHMEQLRLAPSQMQPRGQLKKPLKDILRDISRKSKATVEMRGGPSGSIIFEGKGSVESVRQALREVAQQVGSKVRFESKMKNQHYTHIFPSLAIGPRSYSYLRTPTYHWSPGCSCPGPSDPDWSARSSSPS